MIQEQQGILETFQHGEPSVDHDDVVALLRLFTKSYRHLLLNMNDDEFFAGGKLLRYPRQSQKWAAGSRGLV